MPKATENVQVLVKLSTNCPPYMLFVVFIHGGYTTKMIITKRLNRKKSIVTGDQGSK